MTREQFFNVLNKVNEHNKYELGNYQISDAYWSTCDLILREYLNNGGGSAKGFLGISTNKCLDAYDYIYEHKEELIEQNMISENGFNNFGFSLWKKYNFPKRF